MKTKKLLVLLWTGAITAFTVLTLINASGLSKDKDWTIFSSLMLIYSLVFSYLVVERKENNLPLTIVTTATITIFVLGFVWHYYFINLLLLFHALWWMAITATLLFLLNKKITPTAS
ncbi:MAG: hypothetical protein COX77_02120 [Candidatus Komeilibacteria bacterium CG_4_10_14_0_2_um_filter_37_10]|uniref:Uncharacterized protein n=1 Tax=Candidatus Komeilibacteria bacterium CG_4_10_14_0_2_um_filter_37_10 TaxID=1974470 RepID=A0A2M7VF75_9BACT|nr:MAG: hypothetical protein COX77_02120 [Candidatus Komeilibacteria bacterium CG_4_10_14_0_2_um_filter_37_10]